MKNKLAIGIGAVIVLVSAVWFLTAKDDSSLSEILITAKSGDFKIEITSTGELEAKNSVKILGPSGMRAARIYQVKINHMIEEGTLVKKGDYIAKLDESELIQRIQKAESSLEQASSTYTETKLDTALNLRKARDQLINLEYAVEEKDIILSQSKFEPPATIKQAEINLFKAKRAYSQARENYQLKSKKAKTRMQIAGARLAENKRQLGILEKVKKDFTILAPEPGMLIYKRHWDGSKRGVGTMVTSWNPVVATLPDLNTMVSKTYINEVDIRSVKIGQEVNIGLDAFPDKTLTGKVITVANIGEQKPNSDSKVFQVKVQINESDTTLRPSMTTSNTIIASTIPNVIFIPLECLHSQGDSVTYVLKKSGIGYSKQQVIVGENNADEAVIEKGINEGDRLFLSIPGDAKDIPISYLEK